jgi:hypothetical protein
MRILPELKPVIVTRRCFGGRFPPDLGIATVNASSISVMMSANAASFKLTRAD